MKPSSMESSLEGLMMRPQNFSVNDGEGIRTVLFLQSVPCGASGVQILSALQ